jgi:hypothetical protein
MFMPYFEGADTASPLQGGRFAVMVPQPYVFNRDTLAVVPCYARRGDLTAAIFPSMGYGSRLYNNIGPNG